MRKRPLNGEKSQNPLSQCAGCLYRGGWGLNRVMRVLRITSKNTATRWRRIAGVAASAKHTGKKDPSAPCSRFNRRRFGQFTVKQILLSNSRSIQNTAKSWTRARDKQLPKPHKWASWMDQYRNDPVLKVTHLLRKRVRNMVRRGDKSDTTLNLLGCTREHFMAHIEGQFAKGMSWANLGVGRGHWNLEHVLPCASFDLTKPEHQRICFHWTNIRPMWAIANIKKGDTITEPAMNLRLNA